MAFENLLDQRPSDAWKQRNVFDWSYLAKVDNVSFQGSDVTPFALSERDRLSEL